MLKIEEAENTKRRTTKHNLKKTRTLMDKLHKPHQIPRVIKWALEGLADPVPHVTTVINVQIYHVKFQFLSKIFFIRVKIRKSFVLLRIVKVLYCRLKQITLTQHSYNRNVRCI